MSVNTTADDRVEKAKEHIEEAVKELSEIIVDKCYGSDEFSVEYTSTLICTFNKLVRMRRDL